MNGIDGMIRREPQISEQGGQISEGKMCCGWVLGKAEDFSTTNETNRHE
jgi:hypothetical protein